MGELGDFNPENYAPELPNDLLLKPIKPSVDNREGLPPQEQAAVNSTIDLIANGMLDADNLEALESALEVARLERLKNDPNAVGAYLLGVAEARFAMQDQDVLYETAEALQNIPDRPDFAKFQAVWREAVNVVLRNAADLALPDLVEQFRDRVQSFGENDMQRGYERYLESAYKSSLYGLLWDENGSLRSDEAIAQVFDKYLEAQEGLKEKQDYWLEYLLNSARQTRLRQSEDEADRRRMAQNN